MDNIKGKEFLIKEIAERADFTIGDVRTIWNVFEEIVCEIIEQKGELLVGGLFKISVSEIREHEGWDAYRSIPQRVPLSYRIKIKAAKSLLKLLK